MENHRDNDELKLHYDNSLSSKDLYKVFAADYLIHFYKSYNKKEIEKSLVKLIKRLEIVVSSLDYLTLEPISNTFYFIKEALSYDLINKSKEDKCFNSIFVSKLHKVFGNFLKILVKDFIHKNNDLEFIKQKDNNDCKPVLESLAILLNLDIMFFEHDRRIDIKPTSEFSPMIPKMIIEHKKKKQAYKVKCAVKKDCSKFYLQSNEIALKTWKKYNLHRVSYVKSKEEILLFSFIPDESCKLLDNLHNDLIEDLDKPLKKIIKVVPEKEQVENTLKQILDKENIKSNVKWWVPVYKLLTGTNSSDKKSKPVIEEEWEKLYYLSMLLITAYGGIDTESLNFIASKVLKDSKGCIEELEISLINYISFYDKVLAYEILPILFKRQITSMTDEKVKSIIVIIKDYIKKMTAPKVIELQEMISVREVEEGYPGVYSYHSLFKDVRENYINGGAEWKKYFFKTYITNELIYSAAVNGKEEVKDHDKSSKKTYVTYTEPVFKTLKDTKTLYFCNGIKELWRNDIYTQIGALTNEPKCFLGDINLDRIYITKRGVKIAFIDHNYRSYLLDKSTFKNSEETAKQIENIVKSFYLTKDYIIKQLNGKTIEKLHINIGKIHLFSLAIALFELFFGVKVESKNGELPNIELPVNSTAENEKIVKSILGNAAVLDNKNTQCKISYTG